jgi:FkbM family methyltransferase
MSITARRAAMRLRRNPRLRALARALPGLSPAYHAVRKGFIQRRGIAHLDYVEGGIRIRSRTREIVNLRLHPLRKEPWTVRWLERNLRPGDVLYDIGANVGVYSLIAAHVSQRQARIVAFEPAYGNYAELCENLLLNRVEDAVVPLPLVLGAERRLGSLSYRVTTPGAAMHTLDGAEPGAYRQPVLVYPLDDLVSLFDVPAPTLIKLDVDGSEAAVLEGAERTLRDPALRSLVVEVDVAQTDRVRELLDGAGFALVERHDDRDGVPLPDIWYGIFDRP